MRFIDVASIIMGFIALPTLGYLWFSSTGLVVGLMAALLGSYIIYLGAQSRMKQEQK